MYDKNLKFSYNKARKEKIQIKHFLELIIIINKF